MHLHLNFIIFYQHLKKIKLLQKLKVILSYWELSVNFAQPGFWMCSLFCKYLETNYVLCFYNNNFYQEGECAGVCIHIISNNATWKRWKFFIENFEQFLFFNFHSFLLPNIFFSKSKSIQKIWIMWFTSIGMVRVV